MISIAFLFASCISRVQTATRIAGAVFGLGIVIVNFLVGTGPVLTPLIMDPLIFIYFWRGLYGVVPPVAFGSVAQHITAQTMPAHRVDQVTNETFLQFKIIYSSELYGRSTSATRKSKR